MNEYSNLSDFSDDEWKEFDFKENDWEGEDYRNADKDKVDRESIKDKYLVVAWVKLKSLLKKLFGLWAQSCYSKNCIERIVNQSAC